MGAAPAEHSGIASAVNNVVARAAGLLAVASLPLLAGLTGAAALDAGELAAWVPHRHGHRRAARGRRRRVAAVVTIRNPARTRMPTAPMPSLASWHCACRCAAAPLRGTGGGAKLSPPRRGTRGRGR